MFQAKSSSVCGASGYYLVFSRLRGQERSRGQHGRSVGHVAMVVHERWVVWGLTAAPSQRWEHKGPLIESHYGTDTTDPPKHSHSCTIISQRPHNFIPTPHYIAVSGSGLHRHCIEHHLPTTHHISGHLIQFCKGNECKASCAVGWGMLLSWWELSNVIKIHAGVLHIQPVELTGTIARKQALPFLFFILIDRGYGAMQGGRSEEMRFQSCLSVCPV